MDIKRKRKNRAVLISWRICAAQMKEYTADRVTTRHIAVAEKPVFYFGRFQAVNHECQTRRWNGSIRKKVDETIAVLRVLKQWVESESGGFPWPVPGMAKVSPGMGASLLFIEEPCCLRTMKYCRSSRADVDAYRYG